MLLKFFKVNNVPIFALKADMDISRVACKILGAAYEPNHKIWHFPAYYPFGTRVLEELNLVFGNRITKDQSVVDREKALKGIPYFLQTKAIPNFKFKTNPMAHQIEGMLHAMTHLRLGLFWDCGVGKTKVIVDLVRYLKISTLYVCPARLVENVAEEFQTHSFDDELEVVPILGSKNNKLDIIKSMTDTEPTKPRVIVVGYETVSKSTKMGTTDLGKNGEPIELVTYPYTDYISNLSYQMIVFDESHKLRTVKSNASNCAIKLASKAYRRILLTGTPSLGNPLHLYMQIKILVPWKYPNYYSFKNTFVKISPHNKYVITGFKNLHLINQLMTMLSIHKTKEECLDLPDRQVIVKKIGMSEEQEELYNQVKNKLHSSVEYNPIAILVINKLHQICGGTLVDSPIDLTLCNACDNMPKCVDKQVMPFSKNCIRKDIERPINNIIIKDNPKLDYLLELVDTIVNGEGKKVIIWYRYHNEYEIIKKALEKNKYEFVDYKSGHSAVNEFQSNKSIGVFLAQIQSSSGITLTAATYTIFYALSYDLEHYLQARDRMYRKGQIHKTTEYHLVAATPTTNTTLDSIIYKSISNKQSVNDIMLRMDLRNEFIHEVLK